MIIQSTPILIIILSEELFCSDTEDIGHILVLAHRHNWKTYYAIIGINICSPLARPGHVV